MSGTWQVHYIAQSNKVFHRRRLGVVHQYLLMQALWDVVSKREHPCVFIDTSTFCVRRPFLVPGIEIARSHLQIVHDLCRL